MEHLSAELSLKLSVNDQIFNSDHPGLLAFISYHLIFRAVQRFLSQGREDSDFHRVTQITRLILRF